jgi:magnesium transporter
MLTIYSSGSKPLKVWQPGTKAPTGVIWIDLIDPTEDERQQACVLLGTRLPTRDQTSAIELSSRLRSSETVLRLNIPSFVRTHGTKGLMTPLGFVVTPKVLATVRYADSLSFDQVAGVIASSDAPQSAIDVFIALMESIVDVGADRLESLGNDLSTLSEDVFSEVRRERDFLRNALLKVGAMQRQINQIRAAMLGASRVITFMCDTAPKWIESNLHGQFRSIQADLGSLGEFQQQMSDRLQFMLDAVLGLINNDQNDIMKVLTIVSVVTVPPMILAGIWGMNFKSIPEYNWPHGYAFALTMIVLSMVLPLIFFKIKKWL